MVVVATVSLTFDDHRNTEYEANYGDWNEPTGVMNQPGEVKAELFTVIILDKVQRLHVVEETMSNHAIRKSPPVVEPGWNDMIAFRHMYREMLKNDAALHHVVYVNLFL